MLDWVHDLYSRTMLKTCNSKYKLGLIYNYILHNSPMFEIAVLNKGDLLEHHPYVIT